MPCRLQTELPQLRGASPTKFDRGYKYSAPGINPILDRLRSFGQTRGLAFGAYGEASPDVHALLTVAADGLAARQWRDMGARTQEEARSFIVSSLRRRLGLVICHEFARHRIRRVPYIGVPRAVVERRMQRGQLVGGPHVRIRLCGTSGSLVS